MTTYITNINSGNLKEVLTKIKKEDTLIIFHSSNEKQVLRNFCSSLLTAKTAWISAVEAVFLMFKNFFKYPHFLKSPSVIYVRRVKRLP